MQDMASRAESLAQSALLAALIKELWTSKILTESQAKNLIENAKLALTHADPEDSLAKAAVQQLQAIALGASVFP